MSPAGHFPALFFAATFCVSAKPMINETRLKGPMIYGEGFPGSAPNTTTTRVCLEKIILTSTYMILSVLMIDQLSFKKVIFGAKLMSIHLQFSANIK